VRGTGSAGRITKSDVLAAAEAPSAIAPEARPSPAQAAAAPPLPALRGRGTRRERMSPLRRRIAERLVAAQHGAAMLTTFNETDMTAVLAVRKEYQEQFTQKYGVGLGFMSFFVKACVSALHSFPRVNAFVAGEEVEYHDFVDVAIAVSTEKGLVVPVLRNAESLNFAQIEAGVKSLADRARESKLTVDELTGGTFTITNGGVFGSLLSTPILNPPQSAILGMHRIVNRPVEDPDHPGQIALRPMMYLALTYDHRLVDGEQAVRFLVHVRRAIEDPKRLLLDL
jgi:2-oxoglutarate dehydrogenase E2 component (dihydrolipoamide succinyltransferase)